METVEKNLVATATKKATPTGVTKKELINTVVPMIPSKGANAGQQMYVINNKHWSKLEPKPTDTHINLEEVDVPEKGLRLNVVGYSADSRMSIAEKISLVTSNDAGYAQALAILLK